MKLLGRDISGEELLEKVRVRLEARGLWPQPEAPSAEPGVEPRVDPRDFNLQALEEHADPTRPLPLHTHRGGLGQAVVLAKWAFRKTYQVFINEALSRQRIFNGHVRDAYAQLSAEVNRLRAQVEALEAAVREAPEESERIEAAPPPPEPEPAWDATSALPEAPAEAPADTAGESRKPRRAESRRSKPTSSPSESPAQETAPDAAVPRPKRRKGSTSGEAEPGDGATEAHGKARRPGSSRRVKRGGPSGAA